MKRNRLIQYRQRVAKIASTIEMGISAVVLIAILVPSVRVV